MASLERQGLNTDNLGETTQQEIDEEIVQLMRPRQALYELSSSMIWLDNRPDFAKLHRRAVQSTGRIPDGAPTARPEGMLLNSLGHHYVYITAGWEVGIYNTARSCQRQGVTKAQLLEVMMAAQIMGGMACLESIYRAMAAFFHDYRDRPEPAKFPPGWAPDIASFQCGLDLTTSDLTKQDLTGLTEWYLKTIGEVPRWVTFTAKYHPTFLKAYRAKWEGAFKGALPKQMMPYMMLRHSIVNGFRDGIREAGLLCKAWGVKTDYIIHGVMGSAYYKNGQHVIQIAQDALADVLEDRTPAPADLAVGQRQPANG